MDTIPVDAWPKLFSREWWTFANTFADWFSAIGTISAVVVALYLARQDSRIALRVVVGLRLMIQRGVDEHPAFFSIEVTNIGRRPARITNLVMADGFPFRARMIMIPPANALSATVPATIGDGESASYFVPWDEFEQRNGEMIRTHFAGPLGRFRARRFRVGVATSARPEDACASYRDGPG